MISLNHFKNKKIAVIGEGIEGKSSAKFLQKQGAKVTILDQKQGEGYLDRLDEYDLVVRSPGIKIEMLEKYVSRNKITSQTKIFFDISPCPIIGITGTKGKGTTSTLIYEMLKKDRKDAHLGGNIGQSPLEFFEHLKSSSVVVLELSSFQLLDLHKSPHIAVILMITSEHLDYHPNVLEYISAKRNIIKFQTSSDFAIINRDYVASNESDVETLGKVFYVSREREVAEGCFARNGVIVIRTNNREIPVFETKDLLLRGKHNYENVCAAVMAAYLAGVSIKNIQEVLADF